MLDFNFEELSSQSAMIFWAIIAVFAAIVEFSTLALVSIWFVAGGIAAFIAAYFHLVFLWQFGIFLLTSIVLFVIMRPFAARVNKNHTPTNTADSMVGQEGITQSELDIVAGTGRVMLDGQDWSAKSITGNNIPANTAVIVERIEGVTLYVKPKF